MLRGCSKPGLGADSPGQEAEEAANVMTPLKQECAGWKARALPESPASRGTQRPCCLQGGLEPPSACARGLRAVTPATLSPLPVECRPHWMQPCWGRA